MHSFFKSKIGWFFSILWLVAFIFAQWGCGSRGDAIWEPVCFPTLNPPGDRVDLIGNSYLVAPGLILTFVSFGIIQSLFQFIGIKVHFAVSVENAKYAYLALMLNFLGIYLVGYLLEATLRKVRTRWRDGVVKKL